VSGRFREEINVFFSNRKFCHDVSFDQVVATPTELSRFTNEGKNICFINMFQARDKWQVIV